MTEHDLTSVTAVAADRYGGPEMLRIVRTASKRPLAGQVQIAIAVVALNRSDLLAMRGEPFFMRLGNGLTRPRYPVVGSDIAGRVVAVGPGVTGFRPGDAVVADLSGFGRGGLAEEVTVDADAVVPIPPGLSLEAAATLPTAGVTALQALRTVANLQQREKILIDGASGGVGGFAIQIARILGGESTAVVGRNKSPLARELGADYTVDYTKTDPTNTHTDTTSTGVTAVYDVVYAVNGHRRLSDYQRILSPTGRFVMTGGSGPLMLQVMLAGKRYRFHTMKTRREDLMLLLDYAATGKITPNIFARYPLNQVSQALTHLEEGHVAGKIIVNVQKGDTHES